jgi:anthranilate synthase component 1
MSLKFRAADFTAAAWVIFPATAHSIPALPLRTGMVKNGKLYVQAGGGVVADSDPEFEYQETVNKSKALIRAAELAIESAKGRN